MRKEENWSGKESVSRNPKRSRDEGDHVASGGKAALDLGFPF